MFQQIRLKACHKSESQIEQAHITKKGVIVLYTKPKDILIFHPSNPSSLINIQPQLPQSFRYKKCISILSLSVAQGGKEERILLLLDQTLCLVRLQLTPLASIQILAIQLIPVLSQQEKNIRRRQLSCIGFCENKLLFCLNARHRYLKIYSIQVNETISNLREYHLDMDLEDEGQDDLNDILRSYQIKLFGHYVFLYQTFRKRQQSHRLICINIHGFSQQVQILYLPQNEQYSLLKDIFIIPIPKQIQELTILLFFQVKDSLQIVQASLSNLTVPLKKVKHNRLVLHQIISSSLTPQALDLNGQDYCLDKLNILAYGSHSSVQEDKLLIIGAPFSCQSASIVNDLTLPSQLIHTASNNHSNYLITKNGIFQIILIGKSHIYSWLLRQVSNSEILQRMMQQMLD